MSLSGCLGGTTPPPRQSRVFEQVQATQDSIEVVIEDQPVVESRAEVDGSVANDVPGQLAGLLGALSPVGVAAAKGKGKGATGRGTGRSSSAPKGWGGHSKYHGGHDDYDDWREEHDEEVRPYEAVVTTAAIGFVATDAQMEENAPPPGPIDWDKTWDDPDPGQTLEYSFGREGWYRSGVELEAKGDDHRFGWECVDFEVDETSSGAVIDDSWKVSPRL